MAAGLKPCPFCGGQATTRARRKNVYDKWFVFVQCETCDAQTRIRTKLNDVEPEYGDAEFWDDDAVRKVNEMWNRRSGNE